MSYIDKAEFRNTTEVSEEKLEKKKRLTRNEFQTVGKFGLPLVRSQKIDTDKIEPWGYTKTKADDKVNGHKTVHFFTHDWLFETVYSKPEDALEKLSQYYVLMTPDFSLYADMPIALQLYSTFKNRWCGAFWQKNGLKVIPTISWSTPESYMFCFDGVERGSVVAVSTYYAEDYEREFMPGYEKMLEVLEPTAVLCYGEPFPHMKGNIKALSPYDHKELIEKLGFDEYMRKYLDGTLYPSN